MAGGLTVGELTGFVDLDTKGVTRGAAAGEAAASRMSREVLAEMRRIEAERATVHLEVDERGVLRGITTATAAVQGFDGQDATAHLKVTADTAGVDQVTAATGRARDALGRYVAAGERASAASERGESSTRRWSLSMKDARGATDKLADGLGRLTPAAGAFAASGLVPAVLGAVAAVTSLVGAVGLLPAVLTSGATGMVALDVATSGFGDALAAVGDPDKFAEAIGKLSPQARAAAISIRDLGPAWKAMQSQVQDQLFAGIGEQVSALGKTYIPMLGQSFGVVAGSANATALGIGTMLQQGYRVADVNSIVGSGAAVWANLLAAVQPLVQVLIDVGVVGGGVLAELTGGIGGAAQRFADFVAEARRTGELAAWIREGVQAFADLFAIVGNVGSLIGSVLDSANISGAGILSTIRQITEQWAVWAASAEGQQQLGEVMSSLHLILGQVATAIGALIVVAAELVTWFTSLPAPVQQAIVGFVTWGMIIGKVAAMLGPLISVIGLIGPKLLSVGGAIVGAAAKWGLLGSAAQAAAASGEVSKLRIVGQWIAMAAAATVNGVRVGAAWLLATGANAAAAIGAMVASSARYVAQWAVMAAGATANALRAAGAWLLVNGVQMATAVATFVATAATMVAQWAVMAAGAMARAVVMAAAWLVAMGPVGWIIAAVVALVALVIANWDTVKQWTVTAWQAVSDAVVAAWEWIKSAVSAAVDWVVNFVTSAFMTYVAIATTVHEAVKNAISSAWEWIKSKVSSLVTGVVDFVTSCWEKAKSIASSAWGALKNTVISTALSLLAWVTSLPGRFLSALGNLGSLLLSAGRDLVNGLWNGISAGWSWLTGMVQNLASSLLSAAKSALGIASPSKEMRDMVGRWIPEGIGVGIIANARSATDAVRAMAADAVIAGQVAAQSAVTTGAAGAAAGVRGIPGPRPLAAVGASAGDDRSVHVEIHNPLPERSSSDLTRRARTLAKLGG